VAPLRLNTRPRSRVLSATARTGRPMKRVSAPCSHDCSANAGGGEERTPSDGGNCARGGNRRFLARSIQLTKSARKGCTSKGYKATHTTAMPRRATLTAALPGRLFSRFCGVETPHRKNALAHTSVYTTAAATTTAKIMELKRRTLTFWRSLASGKIVGWPQKLKVKTGIACKTSTPLLRMPSTWSTLQNLDSQNFASGRGVAGK